MVIYETNEWKGYGKNYSKVQVPFVQTMNMAANNETDIAGIVINAFTEPFEVPKQMFGTIAGMKTADQKEEAL